MPADNIKRAIQRGTGEIPGLTYEEISFEGYGPGGVALIVDCTTDNRNRAVSEIRHTLSKNGGNLGEPNSVRFMFTKKGLIIVDKGGRGRGKAHGACARSGGRRRCRMKAIHGRSPPILPPTTRLKKQYAPQALSR